MEEKRNVPKLRFPGFTDPWEQRKLGEVATVTMGQSPNGAFYTDNPNDIILVQGNADLKDGWVCPKVWTTQITKTANAGDLIISVRAPVGAVGKTAFDVVLGRGVAGIEGDEFLYQALQKKTQDGYWAVVSAGSTFDSISGNELKNTPISVPSSSVERAKVGEQLRKLDSLIALHQRKLDHVKESKKGLLQKMFPKEGANVPELRFPGFTDPWEQRKLGEVVDVRGGKDYKHLKPGPIPVYGTGGLMTYVDDALSKNEDAVGIGRKGTIDQPYKLHAPFWTVDTLFYAVPKTGNDIEFVLCCFQRINWKAKDESTGLPSLSKSAINDTRLLTPRLGEQSRIGALFAKLDSLIALHQRELDHVKELKKGLLQQMFV